MALPDVKAKCATARFRRGGEQARRNSPPTSRRKGGEVGQGDQGRQDPADPVSLVVYCVNAHRRYPRDGDPAQVEARQFELRLHRDDDVGGRRDHRRRARRQAGLRLRVQFHRPLCLRRADARALHSAHSVGRSGHAARRERRQSRSGENLRPNDAAGKSRRPFRALDRHRHHRGGGVGRGRQDRRTSRCTACWPSASTAARCPTKCSAMSAAAGTGRGRPSRICRTRCAAISMPATPW